MEALRVEEMVPLLFYEAISQGFIIYLNLTRVPF